MNIFYHPDIDLKGPNALSSEESKHALRVLRHKEGDLIWVVDGQGGWFEAEIIGTDAKTCAFRVNKVLEQKMPADYYLHIAIAPTKNIARFEWFLEKTSEIGIDEVTPLLCKRSERKVIKKERLEKIQISALKQSQGVFLPKLNELTPLETFLTKSSKERMYDQKYIATCEGDLKHLKERCQVGKNTVILIGPEGDFTFEEVEMAKDAGFSAISLGEKRLRVETAGFVAAHIVHLINT